MVVSGVPKKNGHKHAGEIASMALDLVSVCETFIIPHRQDQKLRIRAGIHSGEIKEKFAIIWYFLLPGILLAYEAAMKFGPDVTVNSLC